jgi:hypothetical protein
MTRGGRIQEGLRLGLGDSVRTRGGNRWDDVEGNTDENACSDIDSGSGTASVHEVASEVVGGREIGVGMIKMDSTSDSGTTFVQEDADVDDGSRGGEF